MISSPTLLCRLAVFGALLCASAPGQQTLIVDGDRRPGYDYADIASAVAAASPGSILKIRELTNLGIYNANLTISKPLRLLGDGLPLLGGNLIIRDIPAGQEFVLGGVRPSCFVGPAPQCGSLSVINCAGSVVFDGLDNDRASDVYWTVEDCARLSIVGCNLYISGGPLTIRRSRVDIASSRIYGGPITIWFFSRSNNPDTVVCEDSTLTVVDSQIEGTTGASSLGMKLVRSHVKISASGVAGGFQRALECDGASSLVLDNGGIAGLNCINVSVEDVPGMAVSDLVPGTSVSTRVWAGRDLSAWMFVGVSNATPYPTPIGDVWLGGPGPWAYLGFAHTTQPNHPSFWSYGEVLTSLPLAMPSGLTLAFQTGCMTPEGRLLLSTSIARVVK